MKHSVNILGISPGTRTVGVAIVKHGILQEWRTKRFPGKWNVQKLKKIIAAIDNISRHHSITHFSIKIAGKGKPHNVKMLVEEIRRYCYSNQIQPSFYTLEEIKLWIGESRQSDHKILMDYLSSYFPELLSERNKEKNNLNAYYYKMFEAVALAMIQWNKSSRSLNE